MGKLEIETQMIFVNILGGIGNQMFQYAFGYAISQKKRGFFKLDISDFKTYSMRNYELGLFNINTAFAFKEEVEKLKYKDENIFAKVLRKVRKKERTLSEQYYKEPHFNFDQKVYDIKEDVYFEGYWQSERYFKKYRKDLLKQFSLSKEIHLHSQQYKIKIENTESVSLHIRRGDYVTCTQANSVHGTCTLDYYKDAVLIIEEKVKSAHFFIFSDDLDWVKVNLDFIENITFVELAEDIPDHEEMFLMSQCKHNIIANSSFSWWGAWLNKNPDKIVLAPNKWFNDSSINTQDLIPEGWIRL